MGLQFRKSKKIGPIRVTMSKSGISTSIGGHGYRVTKRADGRIQKTYSIPGTGIRYTETSGGKKKKDIQGEHGPNIAPSKKHVVKTYTRKELRILAIIMQILSVLLVLMSILLCLVYPVAGIIGIALGIFIFMKGRKYIRIAKTSDNDNIILNKESRPLN